MKLHKNLESEQTSSGNGARNSRKSEPAAGIDQAIARLLEEDTEDEIADLVDSFRLSVWDPSRWCADD